MEGWKKNYIVKDSTIFSLSLKGLHAFEGVYKDSNLRTTNGKHEK